MSGNAQQAHQQQWTRPQHQQPSTPPAAASLPAVNEAATSFVNSTNKEHKIVIWSLEYCEFCWTIFGLFKA